MYQNCTSLVWLVTFLVECYVNALAIALCWMNQWMQYECCKFVHSLIRSNTNMLNIMYTRLLRKVEWYIWTKYGHDGFENVLGRGLHAVSFVNRHSGIRWRIFYQCLDFTERWYYPRYAIRRRLLRWLTSIFARFCACLILCAACWLWYQCFCYQKCASILLYSWRE
jgi:hypothetical protein